MNYPSVRQYTETIKLASKAPKEYFNKLSCLQPMLDAKGNPIMSSGNFAVVFKMYNPKNSKYYALKCFYKEQKGREWYYKKITEELNQELSCHSNGTRNISSSYLLHVQYYEKELLVDIGEANSLYPVLLMEWVDGVTLDKCILQNLGNKKLLHTLAYRFSRMAKWLLSQRYAHGDLKPDNILVTKDYQIVLVDYDGMYVPAMKGKKAIELGSPNFRHPRRTIDDFDEHIDDFPIVCILLSLKAVSLNPNLFAQFITGDKMLFEEHDFLSFNKNRILPLLSQVLYDKELGILLGTFLILLHSHDLPSSVSSVIDIRQSMEIENKSYSEIQAKEVICSFFKSIDLLHINIVYLLSDLFHDGIREYWLPKHLWSRCSIKTVFWDENKYRSMYHWTVKHDSIVYSVKDEFSKKSRPDIYKIPNGINYMHYEYLVDYTYGIMAEMGVVNYFVEKIDRITEIVNERNAYGHNKEDMPF